MVEDKQVIKFHYTPWEGTDIWKNKAAFFAYLRGALRGGWKRYPLKIEYKNSLAIPNFQGSGVTSPRVKKVIKCDECEKWFAQSAIEMDHIKPCGTIRDWETASTFLHNMFCDKDNLRPLCKNCHAIVSYAERMGISMEDAFIEKECIAFSKLPPDKQLSILKAAGIDCSKLKNAAQRKDKYRTHLRGNRETAD